MTRPNVIVVVMDDMSARDAAVMSYLMSEPHGDWTHFPRSVLNTPVCGPSRGNLFTGRYSHNTGITNNETEVLKLLANMPTYGLALHRAGYHTAMIGKYINEYPWDLGTTWQPEGWHHWWAHRIASGSYFDYRATVNGMSVEDFGSADEDYLTDVISGQVTSFIETAREPFFMHIAHWSPHSPEIAAPRHAGSMVAEPVPKQPNHNPADVTDKPAWLQGAYPNQHDATTIAERDAQRRTVWECLQSVDEQLAAMDDALEAKGCLDNTVVMFMTDNGYMFLEQRVVAKRAAYAESVDMGLRIRYPGKALGTSTALASMIDIAPTVCDIAGTRMPIAPDGMSLLPVLDGTLAPEDFREAVLTTWAGEGLSAVAPYTAISTRDQRKLIEYDTDRELYDLAVDQYEQANLAGTGAAGEATLVSQLDRLLAG